MDLSDITGVVSFGVIIDVVANGAQLLTTFSSELLTPLLLFAFTILPNVGTPEGMPWLQDVLVGLVVLFGIVTLLNAVDSAFDRFRGNNGK